MQSKKKILILLPNMIGGGVEKIRLILASEFSKRGYVVEFVLMKATGSLLAEVQKKYTIHDLNIERMLFLPMAIFKLIRSVKPDAILASIWPVTVMSSIGLFLSCQKCTLVLSEHNHLSTQYLNKGFLHNLMMRISMFIGYRIADSLVAVSNGVAEDLASLSFTNINKIKVINNPVQKPQKINYAQRTEVDRLWGNPHDKRILSVGSLKIQKNHELLIKAFKNVNDIVPSKLIIAGSGNQQDLLVRLTESLNLEERVIFPGFQDNISIFYETADLFVLSSDYEGFGNVLLEALIHGLPIVSTDCKSGPAEILDNGKYGTLVPTQDLLSLSQAIISSLNKTSHDLLSLRNRAHTFLPENISSEYLKILFPHDVTYYK